MAGSFGYEAEHYEVSKKIGEERLFPAIEDTAMDVQISVAGVSCRQQIEHFTGRSTRHIAEVLASRIAPEPHAGPRSAPLGEHGVPSPSPQVTLGAAQR